MKVLNPLAFIASISYPFYLLHQNIGYVILVKLESIGLISEFWILVPFMIIAALAYLMHQYIEKPLMRKP